MSPKKEAFMDFISSGERCAQIYAYHEAGHMISALALGAQWAKGRVYQCGHDAESGRYSIAGETIRPYPNTRLNSAIYGFSGIAAESIFYDPASGVIDLEVHAPSVTDWRCIREVSEPRQKRALAKALNLVKAYWDNVEVVAKALLDTYDRNVQSKTDWESTKEYVLARSGAHEAEEGPK